MMTGRERPDTQESLRKMSESFKDDQKKPVLKRLLSFQVFASTLLVTLVIITGLTFNFSLNSEREARAEAESRRVLFENYVVDILESIDKTQNRGVNDREDMVELIARIEVLLEQHANE